MAIADWYSAMLHLKPDALVNLFEVIVLETYQYLKNHVKDCFFKKSRGMIGFIVLHFHLKGKIKIFKSEFSLDQ
jgi:hypothetical protein